MIIKRYLRNIYLKMRCLLLGILFHLKKIQHLQPDQIESIVAIRTDRAGDLVVSLPAIRALKELFPKAKLAVVARSQNLVLLNNNPLIDELIAFQGFWNLLKYLRRRKFSLAVDLLMDYSLRNAWIVFFSNASFKAGFAIAGRGRLFNIAFTPSKQKKTDERASSGSDKIHRRNFSFRLSPFRGGAPAFFIRDKQGPC